MFPFNTLLMSDEVSPPNRSNKMGRNGSDMRHIRRLYLMIELFLPLKYNASSIVNPVIMMSERANVPNIQITNKVITNFVLFP